MRSGPTEAMSQCRGLRDFVPEVLHVTVPKVSNHGLLLGTSFAGNETQTLDFIEGPCVLPRWSAAMAAPGEIHQRAPGRTD